MQCFCPLYLGLLIVSTHLSILVLHFIVLYCNFFDDLQQENQIQKPLQLKTSTTNNITTAAVRVEDRSNNNKVTAPHRESLRL